ncbi:MAG: hypothetical protein GDA52_05805 [Rhodobacteraceae bacterium]|nr:hypothetical protein [Paracoccaceae bacterium]
MITCTLTYKVDPDQVPAFEVYRTQMATDNECRCAHAHAKATGCIRRYDRCFTRPVPDGASPKVPAL